MGKQGKGINRSHIPALNTLFLHEANQNITHYIGSVLREQIPSE